jgi:6-phosphogluconate dehydrogenase
VDDFARVMAGKNGVPARSAAEFLASLESPRRVLIMVPAGKAVDAVINDLKGGLTAGDVLIDGGNTYFTDTERRMKSLEGTGILFVGTGVSGGEEGALWGPSIMPGGNPAAWPMVKSPLQSIAAKTEDGVPCCDWIGSGGAGHFVKMVHNGIEYGLMSAYAEGLNILRHANAGKEAREADAETAPLCDPDYYLYDFNFADIAELWRRGSVISSWMLDLSARALLDSHDLDGFQGRVADSGEGRWTIMAAIEEGVPAQVLSAALYERFTSRGKADFADRLLSAMRHGFGGHKEKEA